MKQNGPLENWIKGFLLFSLFLVPLIQLPQAYNYVLIKLSQLQFFLLFSLLFLLIKNMVATSNAATPVAVSNPGVKLAGFDFGSITSDLGPTVAPMEGSSAAKKV